MLLKITVGTRLDIVMAFIIIIKKNRANANVMSTKMHVAFPLKSIQLP